jgi:gliding motility-associated-like protein
MIFTDDVTGCSNVATEGVIIVNAVPTLTTGAIECDEATSTFSVEYTTDAGATVTSSLGDVNASTVSNIANDQEVVITASIGGCPSVTETVSTDDCKEVIIDISNGVSPNGDGMNDFLEITNLDAYPGNSLSIYNRWGDKVYQLSPYNNEWNGQNNVGGIGGEELPAGTYFYILELDEDQDPIKGYIELKR